MQTARSTAILLLLFTVLCSCFSSGLTAQMVTQDLIAHWRFDEVGGTFVADSVGRSSGSNLGASPNQQGISGRAMSFHGASQGVLLQNVLGDFGAGDFTLSTWVKADGLTPQDGTLFLHYASYGGRQGVVYLAMQRNTNRPRFDLRDGVGTTYTLFAPPLPLGEWHQIVAVRRQQQMELWVDGQLAANTATPGLGNCTDQAARPVQYVRVGGAYTNGGHESLRIVDSEKLDGAIDEMTLHGVALSAAQIAQNHAATLAGLPAWSGVIGHWRFDETTGTSVADATGRSAGLRTGVTAGAPGVQGSAFEFDGIDDAVIVDNHLGNWGEGHLSVSTWVRTEPAPLPSFGVWFHEYSTYGGRFASVTFGCTSDQRPDFEVRDASGLAARATASQPLVPGSWHHVVGVWDGNTARLYLDGDLIASHAVAGIRDGTDQFSRPVNFVRIGGTHTNDYHWSERSAIHAYHRGRLDEVKVFAKALNATEIADEIESVHPSTPPQVTIAQPLPMQVFDSTTIPLQAHIVHPAATTVTSTPAGLAGALPSSGGVVNGMVTVAGDGPQLIGISAVDAFGLVGGSSVEVLVDTTSPVAHVLAPAGATVVGESPITVQVAVSDLTATTVQCAGASQVLPRQGGTATLSIPLVEGSNQLTIRVLDEAGHETVLHHEIVLDSTTPLVEILEPVDGARFGPGNQQVLVRALVNDAAATLVSSTPAGIAGTLPPGGGVAQGLVALVEGANVLSVTAADATTQPASASVTVILDTTPPQAAIVAPEAGAALRGLVDFDVEATDVAPGSGIVSVEFYAANTLLGQVATEPFQWQLDTSLLPDGPTNLRAVVRDGLGNEMPLAVAVVVDNTAPQLTITQPLDLSAASGIVPFEVTATDPASGLTTIVQKVGGLPPTGDGSATYAQPTATAQLQGSEDTRRWPDGNLVFEVHAIDAAGNETVQTATVTVTNSVVADTTCDLTPADGSKVRGIVPLTATIDGPFLSVQLLVDGQPLATGSSSPFQVSFDTRTKLDGPIEVEARVVDASQRIVTTRARLLVDNMRIAEIQPDSLNLRADGGEGRRPIRVRVRGPNVDLLQPLTAHAITLNVPGGSPIAVQPTVPGTGHCGPHDHAGHRNLELGFSRDQLVAAIRAGISGGQIVVRHGRADVPVTLVVDGHILDRHMIEVSGARR